MSAENLAMVVDDNATNRLLACTLLMKMGWSVLEADCGEVAISLSYRQSFRLILLDISMPGLSGKATCELLRSQPNGSASFIVAYTAHAFPDEREQILAAGFDDVLIKPFSREQLEKILQRL